MLALPFRLVLQVTDATGVKGFVFSSKGSAYNYMVIVVGGLLHVLRYKGPCLGLQRSSLYDSVYLCTAAYCCVLPGSAATSGARGLGSP